MYYYQDLGRNLTADETDFNFDYLRAHYQNLLERNMPVALRSQIGRPLTGLDVDNNFQMLDTARLIMEYGDGPYPVFDQVFGAGARFLDPRITLTRPGKSWRIVNGMIREFGVNEPCLTGDGLSLRPAETNLLLWSNNFTAWSNKFGLNFEVGAITGPDLVPASATKLILQSSAAQQRNIAQPLPLVVDDVHTISVFAKAGELHLINIGLDIRTNDSSGCQFDLSTGTVGPLVSAGKLRALAARIAPLAGGWFLCSVDCKVVSGGEASVYPSICPSNEVYTSGRVVQVLDGDGVSGLYVFGASDSKTGPIPYIPTTTAAVTRPADIAHISTSVFPSLWNDDQGAVIFQFRTNAGSNQGIVQIRNPYNTSYYGLGGGGRVYEIYGGATITELTVPGGSFTDWSSVAILYGGGRPASVVCNGAVVGDLTRDSLPGLNWLRFDWNNAWVREWQRLTIFDQRPTDAQMQEWTS